MEEIVPIIVTEDSTPTLSMPFEKVLLVLNAQEKEIKAQKEKYRSALLEAMEQHNIRSITTDNISVTYKDSYDKEVFKNKDFREQYPELYDEFVSFSTVKPSITVKVKE